MESFTGLDHPAIAVADPDAYADWCCRVLGYRRAVRLDQPVHLLRAPDGSFLEVMPQDGTPRPERTTWTPGWSHLALRVDDFDAAERWLDGQGVAWTGPEVEPVGGGRLRSFADPEGFLWQIVAR